MFFSSQIKQKTYTANVKLMDVEIGTKDTALTFVSPEGRTKLYTVHHTLCSQPRKREVARRAFAQPTGDLSKTNEIGCEPITLKIHGTRKHNGSATIQCRDDLVLAICLLA